MNAAEPLIHIQDFHMRFGAKQVIDGLSFDVLRGETFGFLGSNGSGKTTTIRALLGIYRPTSGTLRINGKVFSDDFGARLGYLPEERGLYKKESVRDVMGYFGRLKGMSKAAANDFCRQFLDRVDLADKAELRVDKLSGGEQQKIQLGVTIMNEPELLILDEPTKGFDPVNRRLLMDIIEERKRAGATVMMVTHQMEEVERLCDRIILLKDGRAAAYGTIDEVQNQFGGRTVRVKHTGTIPPSPSYQVTLAETNYAELSVDDGVDEAQVLKELVQAGVVVRGFTAAKRSLDDIFIQVYGENGAGPAAMSGPAGQQPAPAGRAG
ncbi:ABC-2 type transport system ATP-binding protein [Arthrobacter stackebrandtii]|uniref:ABC-2 type transport system ATP-binding protein n=1 Tax=Arthrobacter stackebrandtii TaxID=272161 RepID=A0ABS4YWF6_9MICC|nr:ATP-binding cassette domain-containing protein [Arthrobacter stackebrandtii]MBP2413138.1 ABC-2 type transport system ATP-binding protein [Arthrobacter stackebrandtii]PYH01096.1 ABC transporter ATP-binding protein [Arthrobacter stackebrandtii]